MSQTQEYNDGFETDPNQYRLGDADVNRILGPAPTVEHERRRLGMFKYFEGSVTRSKPAFYTLDSMYGLTAGQEVVGTVDAALFSGESKVVGGRRSKPINKLVLQDALDGHGRTRIVIDRENSSITGTSLMYSFTSAQEKWVDIESDTLVSVTQGIIERLTAKTQ